MERQRAIELLSRIKPLLQSRFGIKQISIFGSTARDEAGDSSDIDILVEFDGTADSKRYYGAQFLIEDSLDCRVDMVTKKALRKELQPHIEKDLIVV